MNRQQISGNKKYLISLYRRRSILAFIAGTLILCLTCVAITSTLVYYTDKGDASLFYFFTVLSAILSATGSAFMIPYAVEGIRKKRFSLPKWVALIQFSATTCEIITLLSVLLVILPINGEDVITGINFWLHLITPSLTVILFSCVETGVLFTRKDTILVQLPYWGYMVVYWTMVILIGEGNGGWRDFYKVQSLLLPLWSVFLIMFLGGYLVASVLRRFHNFRARKGMDRLSALWNADLEPTELKIEAFGLGRYMGGQYQGDEISIPLDVFEMMTERYDVTMEELTKAYIRGVLDQFEERRKANGNNKGRVPGYEDYQGIICWK